MGEGDLEFVRRSRDGWVRCGLGCFFWDFTLGGFTGGLALGVGDVVGRLVRLER